MAKIVFITGSYGLARDVSSSAARGYATAPNGNIRRLMRWSCDAAATADSDLIKHVAEHSASWADRLPRDTIWPESKIISGRAQQAEERPEMNTKTVAEAERERTRRQYAELSSHYGSIGPAAILAALMFASQRTSKNTVVYGGKPA